ncbi:MAG TPA: DUF4157 domain-containing protein, partial [Kofleriaceae bacterium]|nr:DUF4157 domain-containing protein [Kofleriaceae bacterium]
MRPRKQVCRTRLETEAKQATVRARHGRSVDTNELSSTPPSRALGGTGRPLPATMRERLERVFSADLAAVRVHSGDAAANRVGPTRAVAAGAHIYLGANESPTAAATFPVLVHEVAHVL